MGQGDACDLLGRDEVPAGKFNVQVLARTSGGPSVSDNPTQPSISDIG